MELLLHQVLAGLATGTIYACIALAIVMIYQAIDHSEFRARRDGDVLDLHRLAAHPMGRAVLDGLFRRPSPFLCRRRRYRAHRVRRSAMRPCSAISSCSSRCSRILNSLAGFIWDFNIKSFPSPFGTRPLFGNGLMSTHDAGMIVITLICWCCSIVFFRYHAHRLAMRATAANPDSRRGSSASASAG